MGLGRGLIIISVAFAGDDKVVSHRVGLAGVATGIVIRPSDLFLDLADERETSDLRGPVIGVIGFDKAIEVGFGGGHDRLLASLACAREERWEDEILWEGGSCRLQSPVPLKASIAPCLAQ